MKKYELHGWAAFCHVAGVVARRSLKYPEDSRTADIFRNELHREFERYLDTVQQQSGTPGLPGEKLDSRETQLARRASREALTFFFVAFDGVRTDTIVDMQVAKGLRDHILASGRDYIIQGQQERALCKHTKPQSLDVWLRNNLPTNPNTKQATNDVVEQLVNTGLFVVGDFPCPDSPDGRICKGIGLRR